MRKLLLFFAMLCVSIGAWADIPDGATAFGSNGSYWKVDNGVATVYVAKGGDVNSSLYSSSNWSVPTDLENATKVVFETAEGVALSADDTDVLWAFKKAKILDFSGATISGHFQLPETNPVVIATSGADITTFYNTASGNGGYWPQRWQALATNDGSVLNLYMVADANRSDLISSDLISTATDVVIQSVYDNAVVNVNTNLKNSIASIPKQSDGETMRNSLTIVKGKITDGDWAYSCTHIENLILNGLDANNNNITFNSGGSPALTHMNNVDLSDAKNLGNINLGNETELSTLNLTGASFGSSKTVTVSDPVPDNLKINVSDPDNLGFTLVPSSATDKIKGPVLSPYTFASTTMYLHESESNDKFVYWYSGTEQANKVVTIGMSEDRNLSEIADELTDSYQKVIITGPLTSADLDALKKLNCQVLDLSQAVVTDEVLANKFSTENALNENTRFLVAPTTSTRETLVNARSLAGLRNIYSVVAYSENTTATVGNGYNLTSYTRVPGTLQAAVTSAMASAANSWTRNEKSVYTSSVSSFRDVIVSGALNAYDMGGAPSGGLKLDDNGHLAWDTEAVEGSVSDNRTQTGTNTVYGPFSSSFQMTSIDMKEATFESIGDMTISYLGITSSATGKIVISQDPSVKEIPAFFMSSVTDIKAICIPSNIEIIRTRAFYSLDYIWTTSGVNDPEGANTKLDNGATYSQSGDVVYGSTDETLNYRQVCVAGTYTFSSNLKMIETGAFSNATPHVKDVYVLNTVAPECHVDAFNTAMYSGNGGYSPVITDGIITRDSYIKENNQWITMLHYPRETTTPNVQRYTDPTRNYSIATGLRDGKGGIVYFPSQSEFIRAYLQGTYGYTWQAWDPTRVNGGVDNGNMNDTTKPWNADEQASANALYTNNGTTAESTKPYTSFYDVTLGGDNQPSGLVDYYKVNWNETSYSAVETGGNLYPERNTLNSAINETTERDYRGWHQFVLTAYAANTTLEEEPYRSYITDNEWWTICPEFDITYAEAIQLFGTPSKWTASGVEKIPYVSKLKYVRRTYGYDGKNVIYLNFSNNLMIEPEVRNNATDQHGKLDGKGVMIQSSTIPEAGDVIMSAGVPYLIKPNLTASGGGFNRQFRVMSSVDYEKLSDEQKSSTSPRYIKSDVLYQKIKDAQEMNGLDQMAMVKSGTYTVPVFVSGRKDGEQHGYTVEDVEMDGSEPKTYTIAAAPYEKSTEWNYTFVGTLYKSFLPHFCYFLGWDSANNCAKFYYHNGNFDKIDNEMRWANGTGVIVPIKQSVLEEGKFPYEVTEAEGKEPAQWKLQTTFSDDSFMKAGSPAKLYVMDFNTPDVISVGEATSIEAIESEKVGQQKEVYDLQGRKVTTMSKGIYIVGGKKYVVK